MTVSEDLRHALSPALRARYSLGWEPDPLQERVGANDYIDKRLAETIQDGQKCVYDSREAEKSRAFLLRLHFVFAGAQRQFVVLTVRQNPATGRRHQQQRNEQRQG